MSDMLNHLEEKIEYQFQNRSLLLTAVTHTSYANEHRKEKAVHNERLEFLGDAVLEVVSSEYLFHKYPKKQEGELSKIRASMVCEPSLAKCARDLDLPRYLRLGKGEELMGGREKDSITSDATEAVIGAIYLDGGFEAAKTFVMNYILLELSEEDLFKDAKTRLQELIQEQNKKVEYTILSEEGPDHDKHFTAGVFVDGKRIGIGDGRTKKAAEQAAARGAIQSMKKKD